MPARRKTDIWNCIPQSMDEEDVEWPMYVYSGPDVGACHRSEIRHVFKDLIEAKMAWMANDTDIAKTMSGY